MRLPEFLLDTDITRKAWSDFGNKEPGEPNIPTDFIVEDEGYNSRVTGMLKRLDGLVSSGRMSLDAAKGKYPLYAQYRRTKRQR